MKPALRLPGAILLTIAGAAVLSYALKNFGWTGGGLFLSGILLFGSALWLRGPGSPSAGPADKGTGPAGPEPPGPKEDLDSHFPSRNLDELIQRLGSDESMLNVILNSMGEGVLLLNQADRIVLMNPSAEKILETREGDSIGKHYLEVVRHPVLADLLGHSKREGLSSGEIDFTASEEKTFAVSVAAIRAERRLLGQIVVFSDITSMKRLMRMRTEFVANVSHELKTPLTAILGYVETLLSGALDDKKNRGLFLKKISEQAQRLHALITDVLELARIESGLYINSLEPVDLSEVAQQAVDLLKAKWEAKDIQIQQDIPEGTKALAHREGLFHVLENLLDNAIKYSPAKTRIRTFCGQSENGHVEFFVEDEGPGIPREAQTRVFERFFRVDVSRSREAGGTGLGLSIVKHLVEKMDGQVSLKSEEGKGSVFSVTLNKVES
jgi:two-component system, OmpR family, phosphate regulon sensor histidine kinase PhoR